jgi:peptidoglycan/LPS O-acetylase OafA/YrhL
MVLFVEILNPVGRDRFPERATAGRPTSVTGKLLSRFSRETSSGRFIPEMDGLRFVAIGLVFLFHLNGYLIVKSGAVYSFAGQGWLGEIAVVGFRGVELFFAISGFILALPFAAHYLGGAPKVKLRKYFLRRLTRLEPPYMVTLAILFTLAITVQGQRFVDLYRHWGASLIYQHNLIYGAMMGVTWSLEIEVQFYVLVPLLTQLFKVQSTWIRRGQMLAIVIALLVAQQFYLPGHPRLSLSLLAYLQYFLIGFLLADVFVVEWKQRPMRSFYWDVISVVGWPLLFLALRSKVAAHWVFPFLILGLYCAAFSGRACNRFFVNPWITAIGGMCYSIYLIHYQIISATARFTKGLTEGWNYSLHLMAQCLIVGAAVVIIAGTYFLILEKPCMRPDWPQRLWSRVRNQPMPVGQKV